MRRMAVRSSTGVAVLFVAAAASAGTAYVCHPDPPGTRTLRVAGDVVRYDMREERVTLLHREGRKCRRIAWNIRRGHSIGDAQCSTGSRPDRTARSGGTSVSLRRGSGDAPDRLLVAGPGGSRSWPLPDRAHHVDVEGRMAVFSTTESREVYSVDLASGRAAIVGLTRRRDTPQLERPGLVFRDNLYKADENAGSTLMKFIPRGHLETAVATVGRPLGVDGRIADIAMDGTRVAIAVRRWHGECDAVLYWNIAWRYSVPITEEEEHTCTWSRRGARIDTVSIGGLRATWTMRVGDEERLLSASSIDCFERVVATALLREGERVLSHAGDGGLLAYAVGRPGGGLLGRLNERMRGETIAAGDARTVAVVADGRRVAVLNRNGQAQLLDWEGNLIRAIDVGGARAIALRDHRLLVLTDGATLDVFDVGSGRRVDSWPVPAGVEPKLDAHFGVAVVTSNSAVFALDLGTGRQAVIARAPTSVLAEIEAPGVAYAYSDSGRGVVRYVPYSRIERLLGMRAR